MAYTAFKERKDDVTTLAPFAFNDDEKKDLLHCYNSPGKRLNALKTAISEIQPDNVRNKCPYCWIDTARTFDHYLPKDTFPEFAVHCLNLLPSCFTCNGKKGEKYRENGRKTFLHLYVDCVPEGRYLSTRIRIINGDPKATFTLARPATFEDQDFALLKAHFDELNLLQRFSEEAPSVFSEAERLVRAHLKEKSRVEVARFFREEAGSLASEIHPNYWRAILYQALSENDDFIDRCLV